VSPKPKRDLAEMRDRLFREVDRVLGAAEKATAAQLTWKPAPNANTILVLAAHVVGAAERHIVVQVGAHEGTGSREQEFAGKMDLAAIKARWAMVRQSVAEVFDELPPGRLDEEVPGPVGSHTVHWLIVHAIAHSAEHAGQAELTREIAEARA
jgi:uncharacterized damage-inducible protein DinB